MSDGEISYTYKGAAERVGRSVSQVKRWRREGMPTETDDEGRVVISHSVLMAEYRKRLAQDPVHRLRMQRANHTASSRLDTGASHPPNV